MALNARQRRFYRHTCDIYQVTHTPNSDGIGTPGGETVTKIASGVKYLHDATPNFPQVTEAGRVIEANVLTTDHGYFDIAQMVPDGGYIKNTTLGPRGGRWYRILSADQSFDVLPFANSAVYPLRQVEKPPAGVL